MLTERIIRDAKSTGKTRTIWDTKVPGLGLQITRGRTKNFVIRYHANGKRRQAILARVGQLDLAEARKRAGPELAAIRAGEPDPLRRREVAAAAPTVADGLDRFFGEEAPRRIADGLISERTVYDYRKQSGRTIRPRLGSIKIADVTRHDIERALANTAPVQRNRQLALLSRLFTYWQRIEWCEPGHNPARLIEKTREEPRDRVLAPSEIAALAGALDSSPELFAVSAIRFLMLTGWRSGEALALEWENVNFETAEVLLPTTKIGRDNRPVGAFALELLATLPEVNGNRFVFAGARGAALGYRKLRLVFASACEAADIPDCRLHDIRRSVATTAAASGLSVFGLRDLLGHKSAVMATRYARRGGSALQENVDANAQRMASMMKGRGGDVVPLRRPGAKRTTVENILS